MKSVLILFDNVINLYIWVLIIHVVISWLVAFNILNTEIDLFMLCLMFHTGLLTLC